MSTADTRPRQIAVTGATGWIGRRLCEAAAGRGLAVRPIPRQALQSPRACAVALEGCDVVVHLAAAVHRPRGASTPDEYVEANERLTARLAAAARAASVGRFVFVSSAKVLGERTDRPARESDAAAPSGPYARSKLAAERLLACEGPDLDVVVVRPVLVYGPGVRANFLSLLRLADTHWPLPLGGAQAPRSMIYIDNLVDALLFLCDAKLAAGHTFFVNDGTDLTVAELVRALRQRLGRSPRLFTLPRGFLERCVRMSAWLGVDLRPTFERLFEPLQVDAGALRAIGWRAPVDLHAALDETVRWYRGR